MKRFGVSVLFGVLLACVLAPLLIGFSPDGGSRAAPDHITLTWTGDPATTMTVTWRMDSSVAEGFVQYRPGDTLSSDSLQAKADLNIFTSDLETNHLFSSTLQDLIPNTRYAYRVGNGEQWSDPYSFTTADPEAAGFKFFIFGDSQAPVHVDAPYEKWHHTLHNAYEANPDAKFMINIGDLVDFGQQAAHWNAWFAASKGVIERIPIMPVAGNHESYGSRDTWKPKYFVEQFSLPRNGPEGLKEQAYSFDYGPVHFVMLDSQQKEQKEYGDIFEIQQKWLDADLTASDATWKLVFFHKPPYEIKLNRSNEEVRAALSPILEKHHVDIVFSAHDHGIARTPAIRDGCFMDRPSEGTIYYVVGQSGGKNYKDLEKKAYNTFFYNPLDQPNYFVAEVRGQKISLQILKQDGTHIDSFFIDKEKDISSDTVLESDDHQVEPKVAAVSFSGN
jgi:hypothetical protein